MTIHRVSLSTIVPDHSLLTTFAVVGITGKARNYSSYRYQTTNKLRRLGLVATKKFDHFFKVLCVVRTKQIFFRTVEALLSIGSFTF